MRLQARHLAFGYPGRTLGTDIDLVVGPGEVLCLLGPNGCGKTTLFRTLLDILPMMAGTVLLDGRPLTDLSRAEVAKAAAYVPQLHAAGFAFIVAEIVLMGRTAHLGPFQPPGRADRAAALAALQDLGIAELADAAYTQISGGQRQLALIARALAQDAQLLVMNEPTASLDFGNQALVLRRIIDLRRRGLAIILSTHDPRPRARQRLRHDRGPAPWREVRRGRHARGGAGAGPARRGLRRARAGRAARRRPARVRPGPPLRRRDVGNWLHLEWFSIQPGHGRTQGLTERQGTHPMANEDRWREDRDRYGREDQGRQDRGSGWTGESFRRGGGESREIRGRERAPGQYGDDRDRDRERSGMWGRGDEDRGFRREGGGSYSREDYGATGYGGGQQGGRDQDRDRGRNGGRDYSSGYTGGSGRGQGSDDFGHEADGRGFVGNEGRGFNYGSDYGRGGDQGRFGGGGYGGGDYGREGYGNRSGSERGNDRGLWDRASDEVASWFGDRDAERRREEDYRGRGPKGYRRSDERIREDINDRLAEDSYVDASEIEVNVSSGEVTLSGTIDSRDARRRAEDITESVSGVSYVQNNLRVQRPGSGGAVGGGSGTGGTAGMAVPPGGTAPSGGPTGSGPLGGTEQDAGSGRTAAEPYRGT